MEVIYIDCDMPVEIDTTEVIKFRGKRIGSYSYGFSGGKVYLESLYIKFRFRRKGLGTQVVRSLLRRGPVLLHPAGESKLFWDNFNSRHYNGFLYLND